MTQNTPTISHFVNGVEKKFKSVEALEEFTAARDLKRQKASIKKAEKAKIDKQKNIAKLLAEGNYDEVAALMT